MSAIRRMLPCVIFALGVAGCGWPARALRGYAEAEPVGTQSLEEGGAFASAPRALRGQVRFLFDDFGSLTTDELQRYAIPWKIAISALVQSRHDRLGDPINQATMRAAMTEYGFIWPRRIANWKGPQPRLDHPMGIVSGTANRGFPPVEIEIANVGCATCHAGPLYGADGLPTGDAWLGLPNASIDLSAYIADLATALDTELERPDTLLATLVTLYPDVSERELSTLRKHVIPGARKQVLEREEMYGGLLPFENGGPGLMNGVGSLRFLFGLIDGDARATQLAWSSPPDLTGTVLRRALLVDGVYAPRGDQRFGPMSADEVTGQHLDGLAGVVSLFVAGTQGISPEHARRAVPAVRDVMEFLRSVRPPPFPGRVDQHLARDGRTVYDKACASCHGTYSDEAHPRLLTHPNRFVAQDRMLTDTVRWGTVDKPSLKFIDRIGYGGLIDPAPSAGYVAPDLSGVWATAPYLHNGSVPTLWHLLHAEARPERFYVGGHALDYDRVGIAGTLDDAGTYRYPDGYSPWSRPFLYDTREPGRSNRGHDFRTLSEDEKRAVLEYLKTL